MVQNTTTSQREHTLWIDILKGIAIILVVWGHNCPDHSFVYTFHMPLFFILSGFLFSTKPTKIYFHRSLFRLIIPYVSFLIIIALPELIQKFSEQDMGGVKHLIFNLLHGGEMLKGPYAVFWFISVLWFSTNLFNLIIIHKWSLWTLPLFICISYIITLLSIPLPLNIHMIPVATTFIMIGYIIKRYSEWLYLKANNKILYLIIASIAILSLIYSYRQQLTIDLKYNNLGIPIVSLFSAVVASSCIACIAIGLSNITLLSKILVFIGNASMIIMFVHLPVKAYLIEPFYPRCNYVCSLVYEILIALFIYCFIRKYNITRCIFMGQPLQPKTFRDPNGNKHINNSIQ